MKFHSHLHTAIAVINQYDGKIPFAGYLISFFKENKKYGSKDRKNIARFCYGFFRMGNALNEIPVEEKILAGLFLSVTQPDELLQFFKPEWNESLPANDDDIFKRIEIIRSTYPAFELHAVFKWTNELSAGIEKKSFVVSHLLQPNLFIRIRPGQEQYVIHKMTEMTIPFQKIGPASVALPNGMDVEKHFSINKEVVIQDLSSQRVGEFFPNTHLAVKHVWDCCAGSGGKSILAYDLIPGIELSVSDKRKSILINLKKRFRQSGIKRYHSFIADLTKNSAAPLKGGKQYDFVIADVPCSGSGTWSRTPEQLVHFGEKKISQYAAMQKAIAGNVIQHLTPGGHLLYITCSVFAKENEEVIQYLLQHYPLQVVRQELLKGYDKKADTLFAALMKKINN